VIVSLYGGKEREIASLPGMHLLIPIQWRADDLVIFATRDSTAPRTQMMTGLRQVWSVPARGGAVRSFGVLPTDCMVHISAVGGGGFACHDLQQIMDMWVMEGLRR
jgi:hypothetical protein